jgi:hypothetical protein
MGGGEGTVDGARLDGVLRGKIWGLDLGVTDHGDGVSGFSDGARDFDRGLSRFDEGSQLFCGELDSFSPDGRRTVVIE